MTATEGSSGSAKAKTRRIIAIVAAAAAAAAFVATVDPPQAGAAESDADIVIVGGTGVVSSVVAAELANCTEGSVQRIAGSNRYATAAAISQRWSSANHPP